MTKKMVKRISESFIPCRISSTFKTFKEFMEGLDIPDDAEICIDMDSYGDAEELYFSYRSQETDEEYEARLKKEHYEQQRITDDEKAMYKILKAKFEGE